MSGFNVVAATEDMDRPDWLAHRRRGIGGSDVAAIAGLSRWTSPFEVWLDKVDAPRPHDGDQSEAAQWGVLLEPVIRDEVARREGLTIHELPALIAHPEHDWMLANVDGLAWHPDDGAGPASALYEGKTTGHWSGAEWGDETEPLVPDAYILQGQHYLAVTGRRRVVYGVLIAGQRLAVRYVERDDELIAHLVDIETEFWQRVQDRTPPDPDGSKATTDLLGRLYEVQTDTSLVADNPDEIRDLLRQRADAKAQAKTLEERAREVENRLKMLAAEHKFVRDPDGRPLFTWREIQTARLDGKALAAAHPDIAAEFTATTSHRRFHVPKGVI